jgi:membrane protein
MANKRVVRLAKILTGTHSGSGNELFQLDGMLERLTHFWVLVVNSFIRNRCLVRAAALSYSSLLALIPLLAVVIGVTSSLLKEQGEDRIYSGINKFIFSMMPPAKLNTNESGLALDLSPLSIPLAATNFAAASGPLAVSTNGLIDTHFTAGAMALAPGINGPAREAPPVSVSAQKTAAKWIHDSVQKVQSGTLGVTGMVFLVFIAIAMISRVEETFNDIWGVTRGRNWLLRIVLYWAAITLCPLVIIGALGLAGSAHLQAVHDFFVRMPIFGSLIFDLLPFVLLWFTFALVYQLVPNTKVKFSAAFIGGLVAGTLWHVNNLFGFLYVSRVVTNTNMYGSLGLVPVFMAGLYFSWAILLFGAQVAYAFQNRLAYLQDRLADNVNQRGREFVALRLMTCLGLRFQNGARPATIPEVSAELNVPSRLVQQVLHTLLCARLVSETHGQENGYVPARPLSDINAWQILLAMRTVGGQELAPCEETSRAEVTGEFARIEEAERQAAISVTMQALVDRTRTVAALPAGAMATTVDDPTSAIAIGSSLAVKVVATPAGGEEPATASVPGNHLEQKVVSQASENVVAKPETTTRRRVATPDENREFPL